jgi:hypothetical protein
MIWRGRLMLLFLMIEVSVVSSLRVEDTDLTPSLVGWAGWLAHLICSI